MQNTALPSSEPLTGRGSVGHGSSSSELFHLLFTLFLLLPLARLPLRPFPWPRTPSPPLRSVLLLQVGSSALSVVTINIVNLVMPYVLNKLSEIERHQTRSYEAISTTRALLIMYFLNTAITVWGAAGGREERGGMSSRLMLRCYDSKSSAPGFSEFYHSMSLRVSLPTSPLTCTQPGTPLLPCLRSDHDCQLLLAPCPGSPPPLMPRS